MLLYLIIIISAGTRTSRQTECQTVMCEVGLFVYILIATTAQLSSTDRYYKASTSRCWYADMAGRLYRHPFRRVDSLLGCDPVLGSWHGLAGNVGRDFSDFGFARCYFEFR